MSNHHRKHSRHKLENISLTIHKGEILGIAGVEGNGQKELAEVITGIQEAGEAKSFWTDRIWQESISADVMRQVFPIFQRTDCQTV